VYARILDGQDLPWEDVLNLVKSEPELAELNRHIIQKALHER
jgi:hypothetical protein